jgi:flavin-dependent dehydrogenase
MDYDLVIVGGGLAGSALAAAMAPTGTRVLIVERDAVFRDRVRGEGMLPWGVAEARQLTSTTACSNAVRIRPAS